MDLIGMRIETTEIGLEIVSGYLISMDIDGIQFDDETDFFNFMENPEICFDYVDESLFEEKKDSGSSLTFYVEDNDEGKKLLLEIEKGLKNLKENETEFDLGTLNITYLSEKEADYANEWKKYFKPFSVGDKLIIKPSWEELTETDGKTVLTIDPGSVFGSGTHETTKLCTLFIEKYMKFGDTLLDLGCGSGILSIAGLLLGAKSADAVDIDENAIHICYENASLNGISKDIYTVKSGDILTDEALDSYYKNKSFDIIVSNIVADVIIALSKNVGSYLKDDGFYIASGIITERLDEVKNALNENGFEILEIETEKEWNALVCKKKK